MLIAKKNRPTGNFAALERTPLDFRTMWQVLHQSAEMYNDNVAYLSNDPHRVHALFTSQINPKQGLFSTDVNYVVLRAILSNIPVTLLVWSISSSPVKRTILRMAWRRSQRIITNDTLTLAELISTHQVPASKVSFIRYGVDTTFFRPPPRPQQGRAMSVVIPGDAFRDDHVAEQLLRDTDTNIVRITRNPQTLAHYNNLRAIHGDRITVKFDIPNHELCYAYHDADICLLPISKNNEPAGLTCLLESMASGLPIVCNNAKTSHDYVVHGHTGFLSPSYEELIRFIRHVPLEKARMLGQNARQWVTQFCDWSVLQRQWAAALYPQSTDPPLVTK